MNITEEQVYGLIFLAMVLAASWAIQRFKARQVGGSAAGTASDPLDKVLLWFDKSNPFRVRDLLNSACIMGRTGAGKSSSSGYQIGKAIVRLPGSSGLLLSSKPEDKDLWRRIFQEAGRSQDMATSIAPEGRVRAAFTAGQPVPDGWIIDHEGRPTNDPAKLYGPPRGALLPFGGHKGFGLSMLVDALAGGLSGAGCCTKPDLPMGGKTDGVFIIAINVAAFQPLPEFAANIANLGQHAKTSPPAPGVKEVLFPGELEARTKRRRLIEGIPIETNVWKAVRQLLERFKLSETHPDVADSASPR